MKRRLGLLAFVAICSLVGCIYTDPIFLPPDLNGSPYFTNYNPKEDPVVVGEEGVEFFVVYTDPDEDDIGLLELQWFLDGQEQGNGNKIYIYPWDLGDKKRATLYVIVSDPAGANAYLDWKLEVESTSQGG